jgi:hypothetical protein
MRHRRRTWGLKSTTDRSINCLTSQEKLETEILDRLLVAASTRYVSSYDIGEVYPSLGDDDTAFPWLQRACDEKARGMAFILVEARLDPLRSDPRFKALLNTMGLAPR